MWDIHQDNRHVNRVKSALSGTYTSAKNRTYLINELSVMTDDITVNSLLYLFFDWDFGAIQLRQTLYSK